jgi:tetratricopeptide (TPR) repeat protein
VKSIVSYIVLLYLGCSYFTASAIGVDISADLDSLDYYISKQDEYTRQKENSINAIKEEILQTKDENGKLYVLYNDLFKEYRSYIYDSAYVCVEKLLELSYILNDSCKITESNLKLGFCYLSSGLFKEAFDIFSQINITDCGNSIKIEYYLNLARFYYDLADYNNNAEFRERYDKMGTQNMSRAIDLLPYGSSNYWSAMGLKQMKSANYAEAINAFERLISTNDYSEHELAIATSSLAYVYSLQGIKSKARYYLIQAAVSDIKSSTKETVALRNLARMLYEEGDVQRAANYIRQALSDALFYNARHRQLEIGNILPIIENERVNIIEKQKNSIIVYSVAISILVILLIIAFFVISKQLRKLNNAKSIIQKTNENLTFINNQLTEANKIKDEYIGHFFNLDSEYIEKMESFQKWVSRKVTAKQFNDLQNIPRKLDARREREDLFARFDQVFLKLFPNFINQFNKLFNPEDRIYLKSGLNTDLRIFALIRLGISDNEKIANFLGYSVNTVYTYKTKIRNKSIIPNDDFEKLIMEIESI